MATALSELERELAALRAEPGGMRTSVMTHVAWVPREWRAAARETLAGLAERHPSRTILLFPEPDADRDAVEADVSLECFAWMQTCVCAEVIELRLLGRRAQAPASVVLPLVLPDLPLFVRWRGRPPFGAPELEQLVDVADRLVVDSAEWDELAYGDLARLFDRVAVSDIAWTRTEPLRRELAARWPDLPASIAAPPAEGTLVRGWLLARVDADVRLVHGELPHGDASALLSRQLDQFGRDAVYESAVRRAAAG